MGQQAGRFHVICCRYTVSSSAAQADDDEVLTPAASNVAPEEDLVSKPPLLPPDTDAMLTAEEARNIIGGQVLLHAMNPARNGNAGQAAPDMLQTTPVLPLT